jgi:hypothetical protein
MARPDGAHRPAVDLLLVIANRAAATEQTNLATNLPLLFEELRARLVALPDLHIGVTTSAMGAGAHTSQIPIARAPTAGAWWLRAARDAHITDGRAYIDATADGASGNFRWARRAACSVRPSGDACPGGSANRAGDAVRRGHLPRAGP